MRPVGWRAGCLVLLAAVVLGGPACSGSTPGPPPRIGDQQFLDRVRAAEAAAADGVSSPSERQMQRVRSVLGLPVAVTFPERTVTVPPDRFLDRLEGKQANDFRLAHDHLQALESSALLSHAATIRDPSTVRTALDRAYRGIPRHHPGLVARLWVAIANAIGRFLTALVRFNGWQTIAAWLLVLGLALVGVRVFGRGRLVPDRQVGTGEAAGRTADRTARDWRRFADDALRRGDLDAAVRAFYRAMLAALAVRGVVRDDPTLTAGECRAAVMAARPSIYPLVATATGAFERVAYGNLPPGMSDVHALEQAERAARAA